MQLVWLADTWLTLLKNIGRQCNGFFNICMLSLMPVYSSETLKMELLILLIMILQVILTREDYLLGMYSPLEVVLLV